jgi:putative ABC transport system permease protein
MSLWMTMRIALNALGRNKTRTVLTMLGMIIGVAAVIAMIALGNGAQSSIEQQIQSVGTNLIMVNAGNWNAGGVRQGQGASSTLTKDDAAAIRGVPGVQYVSATVNTRAQVIAGGQNWNTRIMGSDADLPDIRSWPLQFGAFFTPQDVSVADKMAVLGTVVRDQLFGEDVDPTGQIIRIRNEPFKVVGVLSSKGQGAGGDDQDDAVYIPYTTAQKKLLGITYVQMILVSAQSPDQVTPVSDGITALLRQRHHTSGPENDDFTVRTMEDVAAMRTAASQTMTTLLAAIAGVSLLVGGIGIMNIMLVSVTERTREIGLRKAVGAKRRHILVQFLTESMTLSVVGILLGFGIAQGLTQFLAWPTQVSPQAVALAFGFAGATGVFFGFYPARSAARLSPIDALRYE